MTGALVDSTIEASCVPQADAVFRNRWSPRAFAPTPVPRVAVQTLIDAARRAPSQKNTQPWRFFIATRGGARDALDAVVNPSNRTWSDVAPVLLAVVAHTSGTGANSQLALFDTGSAWMSMALQAELLGLQVHAMGGFDRDRAGLVLDLDADQALVVCLVAVGERGRVDSLPPELQDREAPKPRLSIDEVSTWL